MGVPVDSQLDTVHKRSVCGKGRISLEKAQQRAAVNIPQLRRIGRRVLVGLGTLVACRAVAIWRGAAKQRERGDDKAGGKALWDEDCEGSCEGALRKSGHVRSLEGNPRKRQELLRESKIGFIDSTGSAWIDSENLLINKRGNRASGTSSQGRIQSVFADRATLASRLIFYSGARGIREISSMLDDSGFSLTTGYVSKVANTLIAEHYAKRTEKGIKLINKESFLKDWVNVYKRKRVH